MDGKGFNDTLIGGPGDDIYKVSSSGTTTSLKTPDRLEYGPPMRLSSFSYTSKTCR